MNYQKLGRRIVARIKRGTFRTTASEKVTPFCEEVPGPDQSRRQGERAHSRVLVITQPKAGTYMIAEILRQAGVHHTYLHLGVNKLQAYDGFCLEEGLFNPRKFDVACTIEESRKLVRLGELAVSHLPYKPVTEKLLRGFRIIHVKRELRGALQSWARMLLHSGKRGPQITELIRTEGIAGFIRHHGAHRIKNALAINKWSACDNVISMKMEHILANPQASIGAMLKHVNIEPHMQELEIWERAKNAETLTKSARYSKLEWTDKEESVFREIGGPAANQLLGYKEEFLAHDQ